MHAEDEREFDYKKESEKGPKMWGELKEEWSACKNGKMQSPIDMSDERVQVMSKSDKNTYKPSNAVVTNRGHDISVSNQTKLIHLYIMHAQQMLAVPEGKSFFFFFKVVASTNIYIYIRRIP